MKKTLLTITTCLLGMGSIAEGLEYRKRCAHDSLSPQAAKGRFMWLKRCQKGFLVNFHDELFPDFKDDPQAEKIAVLEQEWLYSGGKLRTRPKYLTFGDPVRGNPEGWQAPSNSEASCGESIPTGYVPLGLCTSSCYHPDEVVWFDEGDVPIKQAFDGGLNQIYTLTDDAFLDDLSFQVRGVESYTDSVMESRHTLVHLTMKSGGTLRITENHPMLKSDGRMVEAEDLKIGDQLVAHDGAFDEIIQKDHEDYVGKVYNVSPDSDSQEGHILVAGGYLTGSSWYQNEGVEQVNRIILRANVPDSLFE